jgi:hypothetical protein
MSILRPFTPTPPAEEPKKSLWQRWKDKQNAWKAERRKLIGTPRPPKKLRMRLPLEEQLKLDEIALRDEEIRKGRR